MSPPKPHAFTSLPKQSGLGPFQPTKVLFIDDSNRPPLSERARKLNEMEALVKENKNIIDRSRPEDVDARERARDNYNKANDLGSEIQDEGQNESNRFSVDATYDDRASKILANMDNDLKDRR